MEPVTTAPAPAATEPVSVTVESPAEPGKEKKFDEFGTMKRLGQLFDTVPNAQTAHRIFHWLSGYVEEQFFPPDPEAAIPFDLGSRPLGG